MVINLDMSSVMFDHWYAIVISSIIIPTILIQTVLIWCVELDHSYLDCVDPDIKSQSSELSKKYNNEACWLYDPILTDLDFESWNSKLSNLFPQ